MKITRRHSLKLAGATMLGSSLKTFAQPDEEPHYLLVIHIDDGMDASILWDARPEEMTTRDKLIQNPYIGHAIGSATQWQGHNGNTSLVTAAAAPLRPYQQ